MTRMHAAVALFSFASVVARGAVGNSTADVVLGQNDFASNVPNQPAAAPTAANLALSNAAHLAVAPSGRLYVADADNHRVLSWPNAATLSSGAPADLVIGQPGFTGGTPNAGGRASGLFLPQGLAVDHRGDLWVCDAYNSRVLRYDNPAANDALPDQVIGQPDFTSAAPNLGNGIGDTDLAQADSLAFPGRVLVRWPDVFIADSGNSRVLHYTAPVGNKPLADRVWGQFDSFAWRAENNDGAGNFTDSPSAANFRHPIGMALDAQGSLFVADWDNHRVLRFDAALTSDTVADAILGQPDFTAGEPDAGGLPAGLELPIDVALDPAGRLWVADSGNHRVLVYPRPRASPLPARVFGQLGSLNAQDANHGLGFFTADADGLSGPTGVAFDPVGGALVVDTNNHRVLRYENAWRVNVAASTLRNALATD